MFELLLLSVVVATAYLGPTAGRRVLSGDIRRGDGERISAVVWFSDMRGSTRLSDEMDPDDYLALLNKYFECTAAPVIEHGGEILNFIGDGVLAVFPIEGADGAAEAVRRATTAVDDAQRLRAEVIEAGTPAGAPREFGIGLDIGELMFGNIGVPERVDFTVIGSAANEVARLESLTKTLGRRILVSQTFADLLPLNWQDLGPHRVQGVERALAVFAPPPET